MITNNYQALLIRAMRIVGNNKTKAMDLISETFISTCNSNEIFESDLSFIKFFSKCMKNTFTWPNSSFCGIKCKEELITKHNHYEDEVEYNEEKYEKLDKLKSELQLHEQILFELSYEKNLSHREIAELLNQADYKINYKVIYRLCEPIKLKLKTICK